ncbi:MAG: hypothetical protein LBT48_03860 [Prevotellaceae bacterium]|jgi:hypothetical protein|nr:hypothetical protein [Prevotellaceae bacterium]
MKHLFLFSNWLLLGCACLLGACSDAGIDPAIYSPVNKTVFSEIILFLKPYVVNNNQKHYVVTDSLRNIVIKINNKTWTANHSYSIDTAYVNHKSTVGSYRVTTESLSYPLLLNVVTYPDKFNTAGEYADLLNNFFNLEPGIYICQIHSFDLSTAGGQAATINTPTLSFPLEVKADQRSANLGEFEIEINP